MIVWLSIENYPTKPNTSLRKSRGNNRPTGAWTCRSGTWVGKQWVDREQWLYLAQGKNIQFKQALWQTVIFFGLWKTISPFLSCLYEIK